MEQFKRCPKCKADPQPLESFGINKKRLDGRQPYCKPCYREVAKAFRISQRTPQIPYVPQGSRTAAGEVKPSAKTRKQNREARQQAAIEFKKSGCRLCPETALCALDFHHLIKGRPIGEAIRDGFNAFNREMRKCIVVCATCHRKLHAGLLTASLEMCCLPTPPPMHEK